MSDISPQHQVIILIAHGFDETATIQLLTRLRQAGVRTALVGLASELVTGHWGVSMRPDFSFFEMIIEEICPLLILPGYPESIHHLFQEREVRLWVRAVLEGGYVAATETAESTLTGITFPDWDEHYLPQGRFTLPSFAQLLIDHAWSKARHSPQATATSTKERSFGIRYL